MHGIPRRLVHAGVVAGLSLAIGFTALHLVPGDPLSVMVEQLARSDAARATLRQQYGLDAPLAGQFARYVGNVMQGNFGVSLATGRPVSETLGAAALNSMLLAGLGILGAAVVGITIGSLHGWFPATRAARIAGTSLTICYAIPEFVLALVFMVLFAYRARLFPIGGYIDARVAYEEALWPRLLSIAHHVVLPALTLSLGWGAGVARLQRHAVAEVAAEPFVRTARAKGAGLSRVLTRHGVLVALPTAVTGVGLMLPAMFSGAVVVEVLYSWPGIGSLLVQAISARDYPLASGAMLAIGVVVALASLATDLVRWWLDPRLRSPSLSVR